MRPNEEQCMQLARLWIHGRKRFQQPTKCAVLARVRFFFILQRKPANLAAHPHDSYFILAARMMMCVCDYMRLLAEITKSLAVHRNYSICFVAQHMRHSTATNTQNRTKDLSGDRIRT